MTSRSQCIRFGAVGAILLLSSLASCKKGDRDRPRYSPGEAEGVLGVPMDSLRPAIAARVGQGTRPGWVTGARWKQVNGLYERYGNAPLWLESDGVKDRAGALLRAIEQAPEHGLSIAEYPIDSIRSLVEGSAGKSPSPQALANADVMMTSAYVAYAADMLRGQVDPKSVSQEWHIGGQAREVDSVLVEAIQSQSMEQALAAMPPQDPDYALLKTAFATYTQLATKGGWPAVPEGAALKPRGKASPARLAALHQRLVAEGYDAGADASASGVYDGALAGAVAQFQTRHGFTADSVVGATTVRALNVPVAYRAGQIAANLERHRWLPRSLGSRYIYVNVPAFRLDAYDGGKEALTMKVVVGQEYEDKATPAFSDSMETVVFRPYWNITDDIAAKETWPKIKADPNYMEANRLETFDDGGTQRLRQLPGEKNSLGLVKFLFPNSFNIYLHDTPEKSLFGKADRAASHGCIRLEHPDQLAQFVLRAPADSVQQLMNSDKDNVSVKLSTKIPVYIVYFTAYGRDGQLYFGDDIYGRDDALERQIGVSRTIS